MTYSQINLGVYSLFFKRIESILNKNAKILKRKKKMKHAFDIG